MADFITQVASVSELTTWYTNTVPSSIPAGDRYIAELAAGTYSLTGVTWTGKTLVSAGQLIIRSASAARMNGSAPARFKPSGSALLSHSFGAVNGFGCNIADGFLFENIQFENPQNGNWNFASGCTLRRCLTLRSASTGGGLVFNGNARAVNSILLNNASGGAAFAGNGAGAHTSNLVITWIDGQAFSLQGTYQNTAWRNVVAINASGGSADPWPTPPTSFFSGASNNATSFASTGNCPGTSPQVGIVGSTNLTAIGSPTTMDAMPVAASALRNNGVAVAINEGLDWYGIARPGTPGIGAVEYQAPVIAWGGELIRSGVTHDGAWDSSAVSWGGAIVRPGATHDGGWMVEPGSITLEGVTAWNTGPVAETWACVSFSRITDGQQVLLLLNAVVTNGAGTAVVTHASLVKGQFYAVSAWDATGARAFIAVRQAL